MIGLPLENNIDQDKRISLSASSFLEYIHGLKTGRPPEIDLFLELLFTISLCGVSGIFPKRGREI